MTFVLWISRLGASAFKDDGNILANTQIQATCGLQSSPITSMSGVKTASKASLTNKNKMQTDSGSTSPLKN